jgi:uncharacterized SAM-binding protein YcdF (DUF218 family)
VIWLSRIMTLGSLVLGAGLFWLGGMIWFASTLPQKVQDTHSITDGIVVLTGGSERIGAGLELLARGRADILLVSGVHHHTNQRVLAELSKATPDLFNCCVELGREAADTVGNAAETAAWVRRKGVQTLRLVTSAYHMPRSLVEFRRLLPHVRIIAHPVFTESVKIRDWWRWPGTSAFLAVEYNKYLISLVRDRFILDKPTQKEV